MNPFVTSIVSILLFAVVTLIASTKSVVSLSKPLTEANPQLTDALRESYAKIYRKWDVPEEESDDFDCEEGDIDEEICPFDDSVICASLEEIEEFCTALLGEKIVVEDSIKGNNQGLNALEGCKVYVNWHDGACCPSNHCYFKYVKLEEF